MKEVRCPKCKKKACKAKGDNIKIEIVCTRCKTPYIYVSEEVKEVVS